MKALGHGQPADLSADQALDIARTSKPEVTEWIDPADPLPVSVGQTRGVVPDGNGGDPTVSGRIARLTLDTIAVTRHDERVGEVAVHFPRVGYRLA